MQNINLIRTSSFSLPIFFFELAFFFIATLVWLPGSSCFWLSLCHMDQSSFSAWPIRAFIIAFFLLLELMQSNEWPGICGASLDHIYSVICFCLANQNVFITVFFLVLGVFPGSLCRTVFPYFWVTFGQSSFIVWPTSSFRSSYFGWRWSSCQAVGGRAGFGHPIILSSGSSFFACPTGTSKLLYAAWH